MTRAKIVRAQRLLSIMFILAAFALLGIASCEGDFNSNAACVPQCGDRECGGDGCGGNCGICGPGNACSLEGVCRLASCGDGKLDPGEECDSGLEEGKEGACISESECVDDGNACTVEQFFGTAENCDATCTRFQIRNCVNGDGCCPDGCNDGNDSDCSANCDNGEIDTNETCDPPESCPTLEDCTEAEACQTPELTGSASNCSAACAYIDITACINGDGCCPTDCTSDNDDDCEPVEAVCGNGTLEQGEECDNTIADGMPGACPENDADCDDNDVCTTDAVEGMASDCSGTCNNTPITVCDGADGCCVRSCTSAMDADCMSLCTTFCTDAIATCTGANEVYADMATCEAACADFVIGDEGDSSGNTLECRFTHLDLAMADPDTHCSHISEAGGGVCQ